MNLFFCIQIIIKGLQYLKKEVRDEVDFIDFITLGIEVPCNGILSLLKGMIKHSQSI